MNEDVQIKYLQSLGEEKVKNILKDMLNECLTSGNQEYSFTITGIDLEKGKMQVEFNIIAIPEENYVGFNGY
jgi:hypothetical protein